MNLYQTVTDRILEQLEAGVIPWRKPWASGLPKNLTTRQEYRGVNLLLLGGKPYTSRYWVTNQEAERLGGRLVKGATATPVIDWHWRTPEELAELTARTGERDPSPYVPVGSAVFNLDQVEHIARPDDDVRIRTTQPNATAAQVFAIMPDKPEIVHSATTGPRYDSDLDRVTLPHLSQFKSAGEYFAMLFHELVRSTGHPKRLNRSGHGEGNPSERHSFEKLAVELGAAFLGAFVGFQPPAGKVIQASCLEGWAKVLREDNRMIMRAASAGQRAADYVRGKVVVPEVLSVSPDQPKMVGLEVASSLRPAFRPTALVQ